jgi:hypothetical protein
LFVVPQYLQSVVGDDPISAGLRRGRHSRWSARADAS